MTGTALTLLLHAGLLAAGQAPASDRPDMVLKWNELTLRMIRAERTAPPMAARNLAVLHVAIYDAVNAVTRTHEPYQVDVPPVAGASPEAAAAAAGYTTLAVLYPKQKEVIDEAYRACVAELSRDASSINGLDLGQRVANKILALRSDDGASSKGQYRLKSGAGFWQPTLPDHREALYPEWGLVKPFAIRRGTQYRPAGPPPLASAAYGEAFDEVKRLGGKDSRDRTPEQTEIATFWADNAGTSTPPGHWNLIAQGLARQRGTSLAENARLFALLNISLADSAVLCWVIKFTYEMWRPVTAIRLADQDGNDTTTPAPDWTPLLDTPPFPAYTSGHSTFSAAGATVLAKFFGTDELRFTTTSEGLPGVSRSFASLWAAAEEAGMSRIYGGIHWRFDNTDGLATGKTLGEYVVRHHLRPRTAPAITESRSAAPAR